LTPPYFRVNLAVMNEVLKRGRGRPKGPSVPNVVNINIDDLLQKLDKIKCTEVKVSRTWLLDIDKMTTFDETTQASEESEKIEFKVS
jgi:hypothetical protein